MHDDSLLSAAVREHVRPGMCVHFSFTHNRSHAFAAEVARQFRGSRSLRLVATGLLDYAVVLAGARTLDGAESAFAGMTYPAPAPARALSDTLAAARSDPHWTNLTVTLRLMAGALGLPAIPTRSLLGTDLAGRPRGRAIVQDPFTGEEMLLLAPLRPDVTFLHAPIADTDGNAIVAGPFGEDLWGAWAARTVLVSAERVVEPGELRRLGPAIGLPAHRVAAVVEAPFGAHPQAQYVWDERLQVASYAEDYAFRSDLRAVQRDSVALERWLDEWVFGVASHREYLERLGSKRLARLRHEATPAFRPPAPTPEPSPATREERAASVAVDVVADRVRAAAAPILFAGIGLSHIAAWTAARVLRDEPAPPVLVAETGLVDFVPVAGDPYLFNYPNSRSAVIHDGFLRMLGTLHATSPGSCLALLSAGQIDRRGAINSTRGADGQFIVGSGGANDLAAGGSDVLLVMPLTPERTPERLSFVTSRPQRLLGLACDHGLLEPEPDDGELVLTALAGGPEERERRVRAAREQCGWELRVARELRTIAAPDPARLALLRSYDPDRALLGRAA